MCVCVIFCGIPSDVRVAINNLESGSFVNAGASLAFFIYVHYVDGTPALDRIPASLFLAQDGFEIRLMACDRVSLLTRSDH